MCAQGNGAGESATPDYSFKPDIIIAMKASVTAYVPKDKVLLNNREAMVEFEGEVPIDILNEQLSMLRKWMGVLDIRVKCCWPMCGQTRIAQVRRVLREGPQNLGSPPIFLQNFDQSRSTDECIRTVSSGVEGTLGGNGQKTDPGLSQIEYLFQALKHQGRERSPSKHGDKK